MLQPWTWKVTYLTQCHRKIAHISVTVDGWKTENGEVTNLHRGKPATKQCLTTLCDKSHKSLLTLWKCGHFLKETLTQKCLLLWGKWRITVSSLSFGLVYPAHSASSTSALTLLNGSLTAQASYITSATSQGPTRNTVTQRDTFELGRRNWSHLPSSQWCSSR